MGTRSPRKSDRATGAAEGTSQGRNQWERGVRVRLGMVRVRLAADVADIFDKRMLEAAASTQKRDVPFAGRADGSERTGHAGVGAAGDTPEAIVGSRPAGGIVVPRGGSDPARSNGLPQQRGGAFQSPGDGPVSRHFGTVIANQGDADGH